MEISSFRLLDTGVIKDFRNKKGIQIIGLSQEPLINLEYRTYLISKVF